MSVLDCPETNIADVRGDLFAITGPLSHATPHERPLWWKFAFLIDRIGLLSVRRRQDVAGVYMVHCKEHGVRRTIIGSLRDIN